MLTVAWYRFRVTFRRRWGGLLTIALLVGLVGGIAMASIAAARRTQSSYPAFLASTNASDLTMSTYGVTGNSAANRYSPALGHRIAQIPGVKLVESWVGVGVLPLEKDGAPNLNSSINPTGSVDGLFFNEDRATPVVGRMADPRRADEFVTTALGARALGWHVGEVIPMGVYTYDQFSQEGFGTPRVAPFRTIDMKLTGLVVFNNQVIEDDADRLPTDDLFTPALTRSLLTVNSVEGTWYAMQLDHSASTPAIEERLIQLLPSGADANFTVTSITEAKVERAVKPESIALGVFGAIAALAALIIGSLAISRVLQSDESDLKALRALGASPSAIFFDGLVGVLGTIVAGALLAFAVAVSLSPLSPFGPIRAVYHPGGIAVDWTVDACGLLVLIGGLGTTALFLAYRRAPHRPASSSRIDRPQNSRLLQLVTSSGVSVSGAVGLRFALKSGRGRTSVPTRSVLVGATLAVVVVTTTLTFSSGLQTLLARPALYGWNWNYALTSENVVPPQALAALSRDRDVSAWSGYHNISVQIDGQTVPVLLGDNHASVAPPLLSGHGVDGDNQIVLGPSTLSLLHKRVGDTVIGSFGTPNTAPLYIPPFKLVITGSATLPAIGGVSNFADHPSMGTGAVLSDHVNPAFLRAAQNPDPNLDGPGLVFVRLRNGLSAAAGRANMNHIATLSDKVFAADPNATGDTIDVLGVQHPLEIVNYQSTGATPVILAAGLAGGAIVALALTLTASVRRRRRELALLKTLGFTARQVAATIAWQASVVAAIAAIVGLPIGIAVGRQLWTLFARNIDAVPHPAVPGSLFLVAAGVLILSNLVATIPARIAARTPAALVLRTE
jgi:ABC-type lipoprotein release transport system permease subunit